MGNITYIILSLVLCTLLCMMYRYRERIGPPMLNTLMRKNSSTPLSMILLWSIRGMIFMLLAGLWWDPSIRGYTTITKTDTHSIIIALDISKSMQADDIDPNRIEKAKSVIHSFIKNNVSHQIGLVVFAGKTFLMAPISSDIRGLGSIVGNITTDTIDQNLPNTSGTNIGDALIQSIESLKKSDSQKKSIILMTDGRANIGIDPIIAAEEAKKNNITIYTIGIGSASGQALSYVDIYGNRQYFYDTNGQKIQADRDDEMLTKIAEITGGAYSIGNAESLLETSMEKITAKMPTPLRQEVIETSKSLAPYIFLALLGCIALHAIIGAYIRKKYILEKNLHF